MLFDYYCPDCRTRNDLHDPECRFTEYSITDIEIGYHHLLKQLVDASTVPKNSLLPDDTDVAPSELADSPDGASKDEDFVRAAIRHLERTNRIAEVSTDRSSEAYRLLPPEEFREAVAEPQFDPIKTVYEKGSVPGCHDNAVFAMVAFYEMVGMSWEETRERVIEWLDESGTWERGGFAEPSMEELVDSKKHVYESGYGWKEKAKAAKKVIDKSL